MLFIHSPQKIDMVMVYDVQWWLSSEQERLLFNTCLIDEEIRNFLIVTNCNLLYPNHCNI